MASLKLGHVGGVVFAVVDFHGPRIDVRFQGGESVGQGWKLVRHGCYLLRFTKRPQFRVPLTG